MDFIQASTSSLCPVALQLKQALRKGSLDIPGREQGGVILWSQRLLTESIHKGRKKPVHLLCFGISSCPTMPQKDNRGLSESPGGSLDLWRLALWSPCLLQQQRPCLNHLSEAALLVKWAIVGLRVHCVQTALSH